jgi:hypothetical protein
MDTKQIVALVLLVAIIVFVAYRYIPRKKHD